MTDELAAAVGTDDPDDHAEDQSEGRHDVRVARNAAVLAIAEVVGKAGSLVYTVLAARALTTSDYGAFAYAVSLSLILASVAAWGFDEYVIQRASRDRGSLHGLISAALTGKMLLAFPLFAGVGFLVAGGRPSGDAVLAMVLVFGAAVADLVSDTGRAAATVRERLTGVSVALVVNRVITAGLAVAALVAGGGLVTISVAYLVGSLSGMVATVVVVHRLGVPLRLTPRVGPSLQLGRSAWAIGVTTVLGLILFRIDAVILEALQGDAEVATYTVAYRLVETVLFVSWSIGRATLPVLAKDEDPVRIRRIIEGALGALSVVYVPFAVVAIFAAEPSITLIFGSQYGELSAQVLQLLAVAPLAFAVSYVLNQVLIARAAFVTLLWISLGTTVLNIVLNLVLIPVWRSRGAGVATVISYAAAGLTTWLVLRRRGLHINPFAGWGPSVVGGAALAVVMVVLTLPVLVEILIGGVAFVAVWWVTARRWTPDQVDLVRRMLPTP